MTKRIVGFDIARALAVFGLVVVNFKIVMVAEKSGPTWLDGAVGLLGGRYAADVVMRPSRCILLLVAALSVGGCLPFNGTGNGNRGPAIDSNQPPVTSGQWVRPAVTDRWQWQLQPNAAGQINTNYVVEIYDIDLFNAPDATIAVLHAQGRRVIAYFSAGTSESFRNDFGEFQASNLGNTLADHPTERWLDVRSANVRRIMLARLDRAAARGFDGVEPDNVDGYSNDPGFPLTAEDQLAFNRFIANEAHLRGLAVGLKNDLDQIPQLVSYFDFAVNEQCHEFNECSVLQPFIDAGKPVFNAEYGASFVNDAATRGQLCADSLARNIRTLVLPIDLDDSFRFSCDP